MTHELKIQKQWADAKLAGEKPFEIRRNDRGFQKGDIVRYKVVDPKTGEPWRKPEEEILYGNDDGCHPIEHCDFAITYVREGADGLEKGYCVYADTPVLRGAVEENPVSAVLGSGVTPSTEDGDSVPPPVPLAGIPGKKENHTDGDSIAKGNLACECYMPPDVEGALCLFSCVSLFSFGKKCSCRESPHFNEDCVLDKR